MESFYRTPKELRSLGRPLWLETSSGEQAREGANIAKSFPAMAMKLWFLALVLLLYEFKGLVGSICVPICRSISLSMYRCMYVCMYVRMVGWLVGWVGGFVCLLVCLLVCLFVCWLVCLYVCMLNKYINKCVYIYTHITYMCKISIRGCLA